MKPTTALCSDSTMSNAPNFCFLCILLQSKKKDHIRRNINSQKKNVFMCSQYYYFDLSKIRVGWTCTTKKLSCLCLNAVEHIWLQLNSNVFFFPVECSKMRESKTLKGV